MKFNEFVNEAPRVAAEKPEIVSAHDDGKTITIKVRGHDGAVRTISNSNPAVLQQQLNLKYGLRLPHSIAKKFAGMPAAMVEDQADNPDSWQSQAADQQRDAETVRMADQDAEAGGLAEEQLDEKSVSKAQFRTMAAAAHNPKFARKVGISSDVAQEFHGADKKSNYKSLPRKVSESKHTTKVMITETRTYKLWESAGRKLMEAQLTADQITQIFQQVEQGANAAPGGNRTLIGRGKDAAEAVNKAWEDLKTKVQNSGPIKGVDAMYDQAAEKLKQATGGDQGVMKYVEKYRAFAKAHPVAQSLIYAALIAAAGITGVAPGGAAVLGLFKLVDKLLQGEKFSSAAYSGAKTGAMAYGAAKVGDYIKGQMAAKADPGMAYNPDVRTPTAGQGAGQSYDAGGTFASTAENPGVRRLANWAVKNFDQNTYDYVPKGMDVFVYDKAGNLVQSITSDGSMRRAGIYTGKQMLDVMKKSAGVYESINLSESQIFLMIGKIVERQRKIDEGIMDTIKGAAGKAVNWAKTKGANLTTKITADKLLQAWKKAGSPTDSDAVAKIIQSAGVPSDSIKQVYGTMKIPFVAAPAAAPAGPNWDEETGAPLSAKAKTEYQTFSPELKAKIQQNIKNKAADPVPNTPNKGIRPLNPAPATAPVAKTPNYGAAPTGYSSVNTTFKQPAVKPAKPAAVAAEDASWGMAPEGRGYRK